MKEQNTFQVTCEVEEKKDILLMTLITPLCGKAIILKYVETIAFPVEYCSQGVRQLPQCQHSLFFPLVQHAGY